MKRLIILLLVFPFVSSCVHDTYSMDNFTNYNLCHGKPFKATKPIKRKCF